MILQEHRVLYGVHAADVGAIGIPPFCRSGTHALNESDGPGRFLIGGTNEVSVRGATGTDQAFELHGGDHVLVAAVTVFIQLGGIVDIDARRDNYGTDLNVYERIFIIVVDALLLAYLQALSAGDGVVSQAVLHVYQVRRRDRLRQLHIDGLS